MNKHKKTLEDYSKWWLKEDINWSEIGVSVVNRPVEIEAFNNIALQSKYIRNLNKWGIELTKEELFIQNLDYIVNKKDFSYDSYKKYNVFRKDNVITKISKISGYSESYIIRILRSITSKVYLKEIVGIDNSTNTNNYYTKREYFRNKLKSVKRVI